MPVALDLTGQRFGRLVVLGPDEHKGPKRTWRCRCDCGRMVLGVRTGSLRQRQRSCGCLKGNAAHGHGQSKTPLWRIWRGMKQRCLNPSRAAYPHYGGRGITISDSWRTDFLAFARDMGPRPPGGTLERIDNDGPYSPENCCWATRREQQQNRRDTQRVTVNGQTFTYGEAARAWGIPRYRLKDRLKLGWSPERALTEPPRRHRSRSQSASPSPDPSQPHS